MRKTGTLFAAAFMVMVLVASCSNTRNDRALDTDLKARMFSDPQVKSLNLDIAVKNGEVTLSGEVPDDAARYQAFKLVSDTPGVKHVVDHMAVQAAQAAPAPRLLITGARGPNPHPWPLTPKRLRRRPRSRPPAPSQPRLLLRRINRKLRQSLRHRHPRPSQLGYKSPPGHPCESRWLIVWIPR
jgi:hypothetical protein